MDGPTACHVGRLFYSSLTLFAVTLPPPFLGTVLSHHFSITFPLNQNERELKLRLIHRGVAKWICLNEWEKLHILSVKSMLEALVRSSKRGSRPPPDQDRGGLPYIQ